MDSQCLSCAYYSYDEDYEEYLCDCDIDEDDYYLHGGKSLYQ